MAETYYSILTSIGKAQIANGIGLGTKVDFVKMKVGDGNGTYYNPTESQLDLIHTVWEGPIGHVALDEDNPNWLNIEVLIPPDVGGFMIREYAVFDANNHMLAIAKCAETYKPLPSDGSTKEINMKMVLAVSNTSSITLKIDPSILFAKKSEVEVVQNQVTAIATEIQNARGTYQNLKARLDYSDTQLSDLTNDRIYYCGTTSGTNTYTASNSKITAYLDGLTVRVKIGTTSTGASTLNINGLGAKTILDTLGNPITSGGLKVGLPYQLCYNGTNFIVLGKGGGGNVTSDKMLLGITATGDSGPVTGTIPSKASATIIPGATDQTIAAGQYLSGAQTIKGDANLLAANIASGINIFGVLGSAILAGAVGGSTTTGVAPNNTPHNVSVNVGFQPRAVLIYNSYGASSILNNFVMTDLGINIKNTSGTNLNTVSITSTGFTGSDSYNRPGGDTINYICFK